jgi:hypothetical protein
MALDIVVVRAPALNAIYRDGEKVEETTAAITDEVLWNLFGPAYATEVVGLPVTDAVSTAPGGGTFPADLEDVTTITSSTPNEAKVAIAAGSRVNASEVAFTPTGELTDVEAQSALETLDARTDPIAFLSNDALDINEDFFNSSVTSGQIGRHGWGSAVSGAGAGITSLSAPDAGVNTGVKRLSTGTTTTGFCGLFLGSNMIVGTPVLTAEWKVRLPALSTAAQEYFCQIGLHDCLSAGFTALHGMMFMYERVGSGTDWEIAILDNGTYTQTGSGITVVANTWTKLKITCDGANVRFYVDGTEAAGSPLSGANLPDAADTYQPNAMIEKNGAGTTASTLDVDRFRLHLEV